MRTMSDLDKQAELADFVAEMNGLIDIGKIRESSDYLLWLENVKEHCLNCYEEIEAIVKIYINNL